MVDPGLLNFRSDRSRAYRLDRRDAGVTNTVYRRDAGADGSTVEMHGASAAQRHAAAELGASHAEHVPQYAEQRRVAVDIDTALNSIDVDGKAHGKTLLLSGRRRRQAKFVIARMVMQP